MYSVHTKDVQPVGTKDRIRRWCSSAPDVVFLVRFFHFWRNEQLHQTCIVYTWRVARRRTCLFLSLFERWATARHLFRPFDRERRNDELFCFYPLPSSSSFFFFSLGGGGSPRGYPHVYDRSSGLGIASVYWVLVDKLDEWQNKRRELQNETFIYCRVG